MKLPSRFEEIAELKLTDRQLRLAIRKRRTAIREHRDQKLDDRCWLDDYVVWALLDDSPPEQKLLPIFDDMMGMCREFYTYRQSFSADPLPADALQDRRLWDKDLIFMNTERLTAELWKIQQEIRIHRDVFGRPRTLGDDRRLYAVLPEKMPADFRLPPKGEFLGEDKAPKAGCPSFWRSHMHCDKVCNRHKWGPCH